VVAGYAALIATAGLAVQLVREWRTWGTRVEVKLRRMSIIGPGKPAEPAVIFELINHSGHLVKITHLGMEPIEKGGQAFFFPTPLPYGTPGPFEVPPRDAITLYQPPDTLGEGDPHHKTRARVTTSDGKTFRSKRVAVGGPAQPVGHERQMSESFRGPLSGAARA
jgi:hypothetical protein